MSNKPVIPFWKPWGAGGCLWRSLLFLLGLVALSFIFAFMRKCHNDKADDDWRASVDPIDNPAQREDPRRPWETPDSVPDPFRTLPPALRDTTEVPGFQDSIPGVPELPPPPRNYIPPIDSSRVAPNPIDSLSSVVAGQIIVLFDAKDLKAEMTDFAQQYKKLFPSSAYSIEYYNLMTGVMLLAVPEEKLVESAKEIMANITSMEYKLTLNEIVSECGKPSDPGFAQSKYNDYYELIQAYDAWDITRGDSSVVVAIIDSYFDLSNPEIAARVVKPLHVQSKTGYVLPPTNAPSLADPNNLQAAYGYIANACHGSHVAGLVVGAQDNGHGASGIAPGCSWMPISVGDNMSNISIIEAFLYAIHNGADVINISIGKKWPANIDKMLSLEDQAEFAKTEWLLGEDVWNFIEKTANDHNCVVVTSAGNSNILSGMDSMKRPGTFVNVEAVDSRGEKADFSSFGQIPEEGLDYSTVAAPGVGIWSARPVFLTDYLNDFNAACDRYGVDPSAKLTLDNDGFMEMDGTSMASPIVAGAVALLKSKNKSLTPQEINDILIMTARQTDSIHRIGPTIQIADALNMVSSGERANFNDILRDHNKIIGRWRSTNTIDLVNPTTKESLGEIWDYFTFTSPTEGYVESYRTDNSLIYRANFTVKWNKDKIIVNQQGKQVAQNGDAISQNDYTFTPDSKGQLEAEARNLVDSSTYTFNLERVN